MQRTWTGLLIGTLALALTGCSTVNEQATERLDLMNVTACQPAADGLTAMYVNQSVQDKTFTNTCDIAIYFDADAPDGAAVQNVTITQAEATSPTYGVLADGASIDVRDSTLITETVDGEHVPLLYRNGATGTIAENEVRGNHRSGIVVRGEGTDVNVHRNEVAGSGRLASGWAENGIQFDEGATGSIKHNTVRDHQYDGADPGGILLYNADGVSVQKNTLLGNDVNIVVWGDENHVSSNTLAGGTYGVWVMGGENNRLVNNAIAGGADGIYGLLVLNYVLDPLVDTKVIRNDVSGFATNTLFNGDENSVVQANIAPAD